jgi:large subunit ribosomal protein L1
MDKTANVSIVVGKRSFTDAQISENAEAAIKALFEAKPDSVSGRFIKSFTLSATMSPAITVDEAPYVKN